MKALVLLDLVRLADWRRWWFVLLPGVVVSWVTGQRVAGEAQDAGLGVNSWDVPLALLNNVVLVTFVLVPLVSLATGQVLTRDRADGYALLVFQRRPSRSVWWLAKLVSLIITTLIATALLCVEALAVGAFLGHGIAWHISPFGDVVPSAADPAAAAAKAWGAPPLPGWPAALRIVPQLGYTALSVAAFLSVCYIPAARWARSWLPFVASMTITFTFFFITPNSVLHPLVHLIWDYHSFAVVDVAISWWASFAVIGAQLTLSALAGCLLLRTTDFMRR